MEQLTAEQVQQERIRLEGAVVNLERKHAAASNLAVVLGSETVTLAEVKNAFAAYYAAESSALQHDVTAVQEQIQQLRGLEEQLSSRLVWARRVQR